MGDVTVPREAQFYLKGGLQRGLHATLESIKVLRETANEVEAEGDPRKSFPAELRGLAKFQQQWLGEALDAFTVLPDELRPDLSLYEGIKPFGPLPDEKSPSREFSSVDEINDEVERLLTLRAQMTRANLKREAQS